MRSYCTRSSRHIVVGMNIFGSLSFASVIKTFLPGFVWLFALCLVEIDFAQLNHYPAWTPKILQSKDQALLVLALAIPASLLLGLISNIAVFMGLNDWLVRKPFETSDGDLHRLHTHFRSELQARCWTALQPTDGTLRASFDKNTDPEVILVERIGFEKLAYVREQYWYHLEFQLNLLISLVVLIVALGSSVILNANSPESMFNIVLVLSVAAIIGCRWLTKAARRNYARHIAKITSLIIAVLSQPLDSKAAPSTVA